MQNLNIKTKYITKEDFKLYTGIDLELQLKSDDNPSNTAEAFLFRVEQRMESFINANFYKLIDECYKKFSDFQKLHYKYALLEQALYVFKNGDISVDSGYDLDKGQIISRSKLKSITIGENAKNELVLCGVWNRSIGASRGADFYGWWMY